MARESQTTRRELLMASLEEVPLGPSTDPAPYLEVVGRAFGDISRYSTLEFPEQAPVRFDSSLEAFSVFVAKTVGTPQSLVAVVEMLVGIISENEDGFFTSLTTEDYQRLTVARDKLSNIIGEDENHFLGPLLAFINNLIKSRDGIPNPSSRESYHLKHHPERMSRSANRPRVKLANLLPQEPETIKDLQDINTAALKPRRPERVGRPANRPRVKLVDLLEREAKHVAAEESDTGTPTNSEA